MKKHWVVGALFFVILGGFFVRFYHFDEWLYFKMDQSRDAFLIGNAIENGPEYLPLLGARAGATNLKHGFLNLGPAYYYFQYLSGKIFNSTEAPVFAYPDLFFSMAVIPLLYLFLCLYFRRRHALYITTMYTFSFLIIQYSRFAWNPNSLQFFIILSFYGLLKFLNDQDIVRKRWWLALFALAITIGSQLHFFGFFSLLGISGLLVLFHFRIWEKGVLRAFFKKETLKQTAFMVGIVLAIFLVLYAPVIISDSMRGGQNAKNFIEALGSKASKKPLIEKLQKGVEENLRYYCVLTTAKCYSGDLAKNVLPVAATGLLIILGLSLALRKLLSEKNQLAKDFLMLMVLWIGIFSLLTVPVAFQLRPRFYIVVFALPFIFLGFLYEFLEKRFGKRAQVASFLITLAILASNAHGTSAWFKEQASAQVRTTAIKRSLILKVKDGVTLGQLKGVTDWMYSRHHEGDRLYYYVKPEHVRPIQYLLANKHDINLNFATLKITAEPHAQYFAVIPAKNDLSAVIKKFGSDFTVLGKKQFGQLMVYEIHFPNRKISDAYKFNKNNAPTDRVFWKDVFGMKKSEKDSIGIDAAE